MVNVQKLQTIIGCQKILDSAHPDQTGSGEAVWSDYSPFATLVDNI